MSCDWSLVDGDPAPGNPQRIRRKGDAFTDIATAGANARWNLRAIADGEAKAVWKGEAADRFAESIETDFVTKLDKLDRSFRKAGHALHDYAVVLTDLQDEAQRTLGIACRAQDDAQQGERRVDRARDDCSRARDEVRQLDAEVKRLNNEYYATLATRGANDLTYDQRYASWRRRYDAARSALRSAAERQNRAGSTFDRAESDTQDARRRLARARDDIAAIKRRRVQAERNAADKLDEASDLGIQNKRWWQAAWDKMSGLTVQVLEFLDKAFEIVGIALAVALVVAAFVFPPAVPFIAVALVGISILKAEVSVILALAGRKSWSDAGVDALFSALDVVTLGAGSKLRLGARAGLKASEKLKYVLPLFGKVGSLGGGVLKLPSTVSSIRGGTWPGWVARNFRKLGRRPHAREEAGTAILGEVGGQIFNEDRIDWSKVGDRARNAVSRLAPPLPLVPPVRLPTSPPRPTSLPGMVAPDG